MTRKKFLFLNNLMMILESKMPIKLLYYVCLTRLTHRNRFISIARWFTKNSFSVE